MNRLACFFSGAHPTGRYGAMMIDMCDYRLLSCHGSYIGAARRFLSEAYGHPKAKQREIMLDSGAYSAWGQGEEVHLDDLIGKYEEIVAAYEPSYKSVWLINLDKIPGERGRTPTREEVEEAFAISDRNFEILHKRFGDRVLPVFHQGETEKRLKEIVAQNPKYVCISPRNDLHEPIRRVWAQRVHQITKDVWTHGLAATGRTMMTDVPWRSVDSAAWTQLAGFGWLMVCTNSKLYVNLVSADSPNKRILGKHYSNLPSVAQETLFALLDEVGISYEEVRQTYGARAVANFYFYNKFTQIIDRRDPAVQQSLIEL